MCLVLLNLGHRAFVPYYLYSDVVLERLIPLMLSGFPRERSRLVGLLVDCCIIFDWLAIASVYISGRPFVLRDASEPRKTLSLSDRAENLEAIEDRLKHDILQEASK